MLEIGVILLKWEWLPAKYMSLYLQRGGKCHKNANTRLNLWQRLALADVTVIPVYYEDFDIRHLKAKTTNSYGTILNPYIGRKEMKVNG